MRSLLSLFIGLMAAAAAHAGGTSPVLSLTGAEAAGAASGARVVAVDGSFDFGDLVEGVFPGALVVWSGTRFVRYGATGAAFAGTAAFLGDGLQPPEVAGLLALGDPAAAPARVTQLRPDRVTALLPADFPHGGASVALVALHQAESFTSNTLTVTLP